MYLAMHPFPLPDKTYYKIGEVAAFLNLKTSVLRFWETEFTFLAPEKSNSGQRLYSKRDVDLILQIKHLLYTEKHTIEGVRNKLSPRRKISGSTICSGSESHSKLLQLIKNELLSIRQDLE